MPAPDLSQKCVCSHIRAHHTNSDGSGACCVEVGISGCSCRAFRAAPSPSPEFALPEIEVSPCAFCGTFTPGNPKEGVLCEECREYFRRGFSIIVPAGNQKPTEPQKD